MDEKISIIVPVYNVEKYLRRCLDSICCQTYKNLEILLIEDGSTDASPEICDEYQKKDDRIVVIHKQNEGISCARNDGIAAATGQYLMYADSDDWMEPDMVEYMYTNLKNAGVRLAFCGYYSVVKNRRLRHTVKEDKILSRREAIHEMDGINVVGMIPSLIWLQIAERGVMDQVRFPEHRTFEDVMTTYKVVEQVDEVLLLKEAKYNYFSRPGSITHSNKENVDLARCYAYETRYRDLVERYPELKDSMLYRYLYTYTKVIRGGISERNKAAFMERRAFFRSQKENLSQNPYVKWIERMELPLLANSNGRQNPRLWGYEVIRMAGRVPWKLGEMLSRC
jgi:glycosyltransferase involved in cell wall biosynthesis